jgi:hypothetical protein
MIDFQHDIATGIMISNAFGLSLKPNNYATRKLEQSVRSNTQTRKMSVGCDVNIANAKSDHFVRTN